MSSPPRCGEAWLRKKDLMQAVDVIWVFGHVVRLSHEVVNQGVRQQIVPSLSDHLVTEPRSPQLILRNPCRSATEGGPGR